MIRIDKPGRRALPVLLTTAAVALAACGGGGSDTPDLRPTAREASAGVAGVNGATASPECAAQVKSLTYYGVANLSDAAKAGKAYMEKAHPGLTVKINTSATTYDQLVQQLSADKAAGKQADVAVAGFDLLPTFARQLGAQELSPELLRSTYDQRFIKLGQVDGKQVGIPEQVSMPVLVYNADMLEKAGVDPATLATTDGLLAAAEKIKAAVPGVVPIDLPTGEQFAQWFLNTLTASKGVPIQKADGSPNLSDPVVLEAARFMAKVGSYGAQSNDPTQQGLVGFGFQKKSAIVGATVASLAFGLKTLRGLGAGGFKAGAMPFPTLPGGTQHPVAGGNALTVLSTDRCQKEMANELVVSLLAPDVVAAGVEAVSYLPVDTVAATQLDAQFYKDYPELTQFKNLGASLVQAPAWPGARGGEVPQVLSDQIVKIMQGADPAEALAEGQAKAAELTSS